MPELIARCSYDDTHTMHPAYANLCMAAYELCESYSDYPKTLNNLLDSMGGRFTTVDSMLVVMEFDTQADLMQFVLTYS